jgi:hypothetical protein
MAVVFTIYVGFNGPDQSPETAMTNRDTLFKILASGGMDGYTVYEGLGLWAGKQEPGATVVMIAQNEQDAVEVGLHACEIAREYKEQAQQEEVWLTRRDESLLVI